MLRNVAIVGVGHSRFGVRVDVRSEELALESVKEALEDANIELKDIDFMVVGSTGVWNSLDSPALNYSDYCGTLPKGSMRVEAMCASGSAALLVGYNLVASKFADIVLVLGIEKMNELPTELQIERMGRGQDFLWEFENIGMTLPAYYALHAVSYMSKYGLKEEHLAEIAVKNHYYGAMNPKAQFRRAITVENVMQSRYIAWPLKLYDCCPLTDGSSAAILCDENVAKKLTDTPIWISGIGASTGTSVITSRGLEYCGIESAVYAANQAYKMAKIDPTEPIKYLDVATVHDCFTIAEIMAYEDLGFCKRGEAQKLVEERQTYVGGIIPVNVDGGLKAKGHPIGATGLSMIYTLTKQLRQEYGKYASPQAQVPIKKGRALAHNVGGAGHYAYVTILSLTKPER